MLATRLHGSIGRIIATGSWPSEAPWAASLRWRYFGGIPLIEDGSQTWSSSSTLNGQLSYRFSNGLELALQGFNLLDREDNDIEYFYLAPPG